MYVLRTLFWFAVVALMMPRGPDLGLGLDRVRSDIAAHRQPISFEAVGTSQWRAVAAPQLRDAAIERFRAAALTRLEAVRAELASADTMPDVAETVRQLRRHPSY